jgi:hypothetical protein
MAQLTNPSLLFSAEDCAVFDRYPNSASWKDVPLADREIFKGVWVKLKALSEKLAESPAALIPLKANTSLYTPNGRSPKEIWSCVYPRAISNKSYGLQVALIISERGAEVCFCQGSGTSQVADPAKKSELEGHFTNMRRHLASVPRELVATIEKSKKREWFYRKSWLTKPNETDFPSLTEWLGYASGPEGSAASVSIYFSPAELEILGFGIFSAFEETLQTFGPILASVYSAPSSPRYWVFQGNPDHFDLDAYLRDRHQIVWTVRQHNERILVSDRVLIWRSGAKAGVIAECVVVDPPSIEIPEDAAELWKKLPENRPSETRCRLRVVTSFVDTPVPRDLIRTTLPELSIIKAPQGTNFAITAEEYATILTLKSTAPKVALLAAPFDEIFASFAEGQWSFDLLQSTLLSLGVDPEEAAVDRRISLTLVKLSGEGVRLRLNFGNWAILTFLNQSVGANRVLYICREDLLPASLPAIEKGYRFADQIDGQSFVLTSCPTERMRDLESAERKAFEASLPQVAKRFQGWESSPFPAAHQAQALEMVFDSEVRDELLRTGLQFKQEDASSALQSILQRYHDERIVFVSSAEKQRYAISAVDPDGVDVQRLDANAPQRVTFAQAEKLIQEVRQQGELEFASLNHTAAVRNTVLQAEPLALTADQKRILFMAENQALIKNFCETLAAMKRENRFYKPAMLLCVLDGIDSGDLVSNQITFDWVAPRFIALMKSLGETVAEQQAAQPFYHLSNDLFWLHSVSNLNDLMKDGGDGPGAARNKIKYALLKDTYWNLLQDPAAHNAVHHQLEKLIMPTPAQLLAAAETAIKNTGFQHAPGLVRRFLGALAAKPFVILTGNSGTGKTKLAALLAHWMAGDSSASNDRYAVVPVGADWTDNRNVVGFVNHLRKDAAANPTYQTTPVLELLLRATADPEHPYFLILDEMNLSHVERYFSDFLSAMESKKPIPLHQEEHALRTPSGASVEREIAFPENLFVIGTVNVDETTYMFSPKVLDRANVLEFRIGTEQAKDFLSQSSNHVAPTTPAPGAPLAFLDLARRARGLAEPALAAPNDNAMKECRDSLQGFFDLLHSSRLEFAFRTISEITRYIHVDFEFAAHKNEWRWLDCLDAQVLQKILPKLHGSRRRLEAILVALATYCEKRDLIASQKRLQRDAELNSYPPANLPDAVALPLSRTKLLEMIEAVRRDQFVSFIQ